VWPDSFPLPQGNSKKEFMAKGGGAIILDNRYNKIDKEAFDIKFKECLVIPLANSNKEYIEVANKIIQNRKSRECLAKRMQEYTFDIDTTIDIGALFG